MWKYFKCERCGRCCKEIGLPWDPQRTNKIAKYLGISAAQLIEKYYGKIVKTQEGIHLEFEETKRTPCPFLESAGPYKICIIYSVRPGPCELYPLETDFGTCGVNCPAFKKLEKRNI